MDGDKFKELAALYAVGALDGAELRDFEVYLRNASAEEKRELQALTETASLLPLALPPTPAPAHLKARLFARVEAEVEATKQENFQQGEAPVPLKTISPPEKSGFSLLDFFRWQPASALMAAACLLLAVTSGLLLWQNSKLSQEKEALARRVAMQSQEMIAKQQELETLASQTTKLISLSGKEAPQASAKIFWDTAKQQWVMYIFNLPVAPADKEYQLWYITNDQQKLSAAVFRTDEKGHGELRVTVPASAVQKLAATAITLEPKGGSTQPTGSIYLVGSIGA